MTFTPYTHHGIGTPDYMCPYCVTPWKCNGPHIYEDDLPQYNADMRVAYEQGLEDARDAVAALMGSPSDQNPTPLDFLIYEEVLPTIDGLRGDHA